MNRKSILALVAGLMALVLVFAGCAKEQADPTTAPTQATEVTTEVPTT